MYVAQSRVGKVGGVQVMVKHPRPADSSDGPGVYTANIVYTEMLMLPAAGGAD